MKIHIVTDDGELLSTVERKELERDAGASISLDDFVYEVVYKVRAEWTRIERLGERA